MPPAARATPLGDKMTCPMQTPVPPGAPIPHAPGPMPILTPGYPKVLIGGAPAARAIVDGMVCVTPGGPVPNMILKGSLTVMIGGMPAARVGDPGAHPGSSVLPPGYPKVDIGG